MSVSGPVYTFDVIGDPAPQGSKRLVAGRMIEASSRLMPWRESIMWAARSVTDEPGWLALDGPIAVTLGFRLRKPSSARKADVWAWRQPDLDKLCRAVGDALTQSGVIVDDARIVSMMASKRYADGGELPGVTVSVAAMPVPVGRQRKDQSEAAAAATAGEDQQT